MLTFSSSVLAFGYIPCQFGRIKAIIMFYTRFYIASTYTCTVKPSYMNTGTYMYKVHAHIHAYIIIGTRLYYASISLSVMDQSIKHNASLIGYCRINVNSNIKHFWKL